MTGLTIAFRVDASAAIGLGHFMRCLTLAKKLNARGHSCLFISANLTAALCNKLIEQGISFLSLPPRPSALAADITSNKYNNININNNTKINNNTNTNHNASENNYTLWLGVSQVDDAEQTLALIASRQIDWLVVDHYGLDAQWHKRLATWVKKIAVVDDLANRPLHCDLLLDQNYGRVANDYNNVIPINACVLAGSMYSLLRAQFLHERKNLTLPRILSDKPKTILISFGGSDTENFTLKTLIAIVKSGYLLVNPTCKIVVILGAHYAFDDALQRFIVQQALPVALHKNIEEVAKVMAPCDMAISAGGSTVWELCCLGIPSVLVAIADNQCNSVALLHKADIAIALKKIEFDQQLITLLNDSQLLQRLNHVAIQAPLCVDGGGADRVVQAMEKLIYA